MPIVHPHPDETGQPVVIQSPSVPTAIEAWADPTAGATSIPDGQVPIELNGVALTPWTDHPRSAEGWDHLDGLNASGLILWLRLAVVLPFAPMTRKRLAAHF